VIGVVYKPGCCGRLLLDSTIHPPLLELELGE
jgi:hypothetical protein